jgi:hypothetical protein
LLTLGQVVPMVSFPAARWAAAGGPALMSRSSQELSWVDVTAPGDGCAFALCDPVAVSGVAGPGKRWPLVLSAAFSQTLSAEAQGARCAGGSSSGISSISMRLRQPAGRAGRL